MSNQYMYNNQTSGKVEQQKDSLIGSLQEIQMARGSIEWAMQNLAPASINNSRQIVRGMIQRFSSNPSEARGNVIEKICGASYDWADTDAELETRPRSNDVSAEVEYHDESNAIELQLTHY